MDALKSLSDSIASLAARSTPKLFYVPSPLGGRTALGFDGKYLLTPAQEAEKGESLTILAPGGREVEAKVAGFDPTLGLAVLELSQELPETAWTGAQGSPALGSLNLVAAYPSPEGPEVRLDSLRFAGGQGDEAYLQTDGAAFPGFSGAAIVDPDGTLAGFLLADKGGNRGWALPAARAAALVPAIVSGRLSMKAWLGVSTVAIEAPPELGQGREGALLIAGVEAGSPADKAGLRVGDVLATLGGSELLEPADLVAALDLAEPGKELKITVFRAGEKKEIAAIPSARERGQGRHEGPHGHHHHGHHGPWWMGGQGCGQRQGR